MTGMLFGLQVCFEYKTYTHWICSGLSSVHRCLDGTTKLQFVRLHWNDLNKWHFFNQLLWSLVVKTVFFLIPSCTFNVKTLNIGSLVKSLCDFCGISVRSDICKHGWFIKCPSFSSTSGLDESRQVWLRNMETWEPNDLWFFKVNPGPVLLESAFKVSNPAYESFLCWRSKPTPHWWKETIEEWIS